MPWLVYHDAFGPRDDISNRDVIAADSREPFTILDQSLDATIAKPIPLETSTTSDNGDRLECSCSEINRR